MNPVIFRKKESKLYLSLPIELIDSKISDILILLDFEKVDDTNFFIDLKNISVIEKNKLILKLNTYLNKQNYECGFDEGSKEILSAANKIKENTAKTKEIAKTLTDKPFLEDRQLSSQKFRRKL